MNKIITITQAEFNGWYYSVKEIIDTYLPRTFANCSEKEFGLRCLLDTDRNINGNRIFSLEIINEKKFVEFQLKYL